MIDVRYTDDAAEAQSLCDQGFEPIECSIGGGSIVGPLQLDHHGPLAHLEGVAIRAYRDHFGARRDDPRFVVTGRPDADATFALAALMGWLPDPDERDLTELAIRINEIDTDPIGRDLTQLPWGETLLAFRALDGRRDAQGFVFRALAWRWLVADPPRWWIDGARQRELDRRDRAAQVAPVWTSGPVALVESPLWGFDVWYGRRGEDPGDPASWASPVVLVRDPRDGTVTVGCPNEAVAESLLGSGGLLNVFARLEPPGWGGRTSIGGSPRGVHLSADEARAAAERVRACVDG